MLLSVHSSKQHANPKKLVTLFMVLLNAVGIEPSTRFRFINSMNPRNSTNSMNPMLLQPLYPPWTLEPLNPSSAIPYTSQNPPGRGF